MNKIDFEISKKHVKKAKNKKKSLFLQERIDEKSKIIYNSYQ